MLMLFGRRGRRVCIRVRVLSDYVNSIRVLVLCEHPHKNDIYKLGIFAVFVFIGICR